MVRLVDLSCRNRAVALVSGPNRPSQARCASSLVYSQLWSRRAAKKRCGRFSDDLMAKTMDISGANKTFHRVMRLGNVFFAHVLDRHIGRMTRVVHANILGIRRNCRPRQSTLMRNLYSGALAGLRDQGLRPFPFSPTISAPRVGVRRPSFVEPLLGSQSAWPLPTSLALQRVFHGKQNAYRRVPPRGDPGCGGAWQSRSRI